MNYKLPLQLRWADIDANFHVRHSVYYDWAALCRITFMHEKGLTESVYHQFNIGPILLERNVDLEEKSGWAIRLQLIWRWSMHDAIFLVGPFNTPFENLPPLKQLG
jgi:acyl-CoA thioester hydrolase